MYKEDTALENNHMQGCLTLLVSREEKLNHNVILIYTTKKAHRKRMGKIPNHFKNVEQEDSIVTRRVA